MINIQCTENLLNKIYKLEKENQYFKKTYADQQISPDKHQGSSIPKFPASNNQHACHLYNTEQEYKQMIRRLIIECVHNGTKLIIFTGRVQKIKSYLKLADINIANLIETNRIAFVHQLDDFFSNGNITADKIRTFFKEEYEKIQGKNPNNLEILFSMDWRNQNPARIIQFEKLLNNNIPKQFKLICQYDMHNFSAKMLKNILKSHPFLISENHIYENFYYIQNDKLSSKHKKSSELMLWLENIARQNAKIDSFQDNIDYKSLFENSGQALIVHNSDGTILNINDKACDILGSSPEKIINKNIKQLFSFKIAKDNLQNLQKSEQSTFQTKYSNPNNSTIHLKITSRWINRQKNTIQSVLRPVTKSKGTEQKLEDSERKYKQLVETTGDIIFVHDKNGKITFVNQAGLNFSGYSKDRVVGKKINDFLPHTEIENLLARKEKREAGDSEPYHFETFFLNKNGDKIHVDINSTPIIENNEYQGSLVVARDITERKQINKEKRQLQKQKHRSQKLETLGTLAGGIGHDFNNILTPVLGYAELIKDELSEDSTNYEYINEIIEGCLRAKDIIMQMLSFSRNKEQDLFPLNIVPIIKETLKLLRPSLPRTIEIKYNLDSNKALINADPTRMHQVIMNLCTNAYQAMAQEGGILTLDLEKIYVDEETSRKYIDMDPGDYIKLVINDTGCGMDTETKAHIFEPFYTTKNKGTGMGLAVVHSIVKSHNGRISVYSDPGIGTTFNLYFPIVDIDEENRKHSQNKIMKGNSSVLLVDDRKDVASILEQMLLQLGYKSTISYSSKNALEIFKQHQDKFDLIISDMVMPDMSGLELSRKLQKLNKKVPILMISGHGYNIDMEQLKKAGVSKLIHKPVRIQELAESLHQIINRD